MTSDYWTTIGAIADVFDGPHATPKKINEGPVFLGIGSLNNGSLDLSKSEHLSEEDFLKWTKRVTPTAGDVVFSYETRLGEAAIIPEGLRCCLGRRMGLLRPKLNKVLPDYLLYAYLGPDFQALISARTIHGSTVDRIALKDLPNFPIQIPPLGEQKSIIDVLKSFDDKIELNRQINQTLEQIAQTIFKSWFVDFEPVKAKIQAKTAGRDPERAAMCAISGKLEPELDQLSPEHYQQLAATAALFPDALVESELGLIPEGWGVNTLKNLTVKIGSGATPRGGSGVYLDEGTAFVRSQNVYDSEFVWDGLARLSDSAANQLKGVEVKLEDVLLNITGASILRTCVVAPEVLPARVNQHVAIIRAKFGIPARYLHLHLLQQKTKDYLMGLNAGASREAVTKGHIESVPTLYPHPEALKCFEQITAPIYNEINQIGSQARTLATLRDTLLPKLLSGERNICDEVKTQEAVHE